MKLAKLTSYLATGIAVIASSAAPSYAASLVSASAVISGNPNQNLDPTAILTQIIANPSQIEAIALANGLTGTFDSDIQLAPGTTTATVNDTFTKPSGTTFTGSAMARANLENSDFSLGTEATATLSDIGGADQVNAAIAGSLFNETFTINDPNLDGTAGELILDLDLDGSTSQTSLAQAFGAAAIASGTTPYLTETFTGNASLVSDPIPFTYGQPLDLSIALGSVVGIAGGNPFPFPVVSSGESLFGNTLTIGGITLNDASGNVVPLSQVNIQGTSGVDYNTVLGVTAAVPEPSSVLGLLVFGGLSAASRFKRQQQ